MLQRMPQDWVRAITPHISNPNALSALKCAVDTEYQNHTVFPQRSLIFHAFQRTPYRDVKVVILGQDPYPTPGHATGMAFSVPQNVKITRSLSNIFKERLNDVGIPVSSSGNLSHWADQGVLLLNTILTVRSGAANSHKSIGWQHIIDPVIEALNHKPHPIVYILWGGHAHAYEKRIDTSKHIVIKSSHPSPLGAYKSGAPFIGSKCFSRTNAALIRHGLTPIDWSN